MEDDISLSQSPAADKPKLQGNVTAIFFLGVAKDTALSVLYVTVEL
jgi:hypothetical protein